MKKFFSGKRLAVCGVIVFLFCCGVWGVFSRQSTQYAVAEPGESTPDQTQLCRLARSGLRRIGCPLKAASVTLKEKLPDGSFRVDIMLENGRTVSGRFYRDRLRFKIAVDEVSLHPREIIIQER